MSERTEGLEMTLPAESANVALVRHAISGVAEDGGMDEERIADLKTVVTEACMNVVVHAYPHGTGLMRIDVTPEEDSLLITVSDSGAGIRPSVDLDEPGSSLRLGFSLISRLCSSFAISGGLDRGTTISMRLPMSGEDPSSPAAGEDPESLPGEVRIVASQPELLASMLSRAISAFAARAGPLGRSDLRRDPARRRDLGRGAGRLRRRASRGSRSRMATAASTCGSAR